MRGNPEVKRIKAEAKAETKKAKDIAKYSVDYDMTIVIKFIFAALIWFLFMLFILEVISIFKSNLGEGDGYLTSEIIHGILGFIGGVVTTIVTFLAKRLADKAVQTVNGNGGEK